MDERDKNLEKYIDPRIGELNKNNLFLETFYLYAVAVEHLLQQSIGFQEQLLNLSLKKAN